MTLRVAVKKHLPGFDLQAEFETDCQRLGMFGSSGSGKSTLAEIVAGWQMPDAGSIWLQGECLTDVDRHFCQQPEKRRVGLVSQQPALFPHLSVRHNLTYGYQRRPRLGMEPDFEKLTRVFHLQHLLERGVNNLSGGEKQRVALCRAILANPRLLILDEPFSALDEHVKYPIIEYLNRINRMIRLPMLFISHSMTELQLMSDQVVVMDAGRAQPLLSLEQLARRQMAVSAEGYLNLLTLHYHHEAAGLFHYAWGRIGLVATRRGAGPADKFVISSKDIILFRRHPQAISARNLLPGKVTAIFAMENKIGVKLDCSGESLIVEVVRTAAADLRLKVGSRLYVVFKAMSLRLLA